MKLSEHSKNKLLGTFAQWSVAKDYADPMYNYLVYGFAPGSFFTAVLANDFGRAIQHSHPSNSIPALKNVVGWMGEVMPEMACGSYEAVSEWMSLNPEQRRSALESRCLIYTQEDEMMLVLQGERTQEPILW